MPGDRFDAVARRLLEHPPTWIPDGLPADRRRAGLLSLPLHLPVTSEPAFGTAVLAAANADLDGIVTSPLRRAVDTAAAAGRTTVLSLNERVGDGT